jgi:hypothetical protein
MAEKESVFGFYGVISSGPVSSSARRFGQGTFVWGKRVLVVGLCELVTALLFLLSDSPPALAQNSQSQAAPEIDTYFKLTPPIRLVFVAQRTREDGKETGSNVAANVDFYLKPLLRLKTATLFQRDESKSKLLVLRAGYAHHWFPGSDPEERIVLEATARYTLVRGAVVSNRLRTDLRFVSNNPFSWRFRERLAVERTFAVSGHHFTPYLRAEIYYDRKPAKWSKTAQDAGLTFPLAKRIEFEAYYEHENDTAQAPNHQLQTLGLILHLYF